MWQPAGGSRHQCVRQSERKYEDLSTGFILRTQSELHMHFALPNSRKLQHVSFLDVHQMWVKNCEGDEIVGFNP